MECSKKQIQGTSRGWPCFPASLCTTSLHFSAISSHMVCHGPAKATTSFSLLQISPKHDFYHEVISAASCLNTHMLLVGDHCTQLALFDGLSSRMVWHDPASAHFSALQISPEHVSYHEDIYSACHTVRFIAQLLHPLLCCLIQQANSARPFT